MQQNQIANGFGNGNLQVVNLNTLNSQPFLTYQTPDGLWHTLGEIATPQSAGFSCVAMGKGNDGNLQILLLGKDDGQPYYIWQADGNGIWTWGGALPTQHTAGFKSVAVGTGNSGNLQVILLGKDDNQPYYIWQAAGNGIWAWGGALPSQNQNGYASLVTCSGNSGNLQVILLGLNDGLPYCIWQAAGNGVWAWLGGLPNQHPAGFGALTAGTGNSGNLQLVVLGKDDQQPYYIWQAAGNGVWAWGGALPNQNNIQFASLTCGVGNSSNLQVLLLDSNGQPHYIWQAAGNGIWAWGGALFAAGSETSYGQMTCGNGNNSNLQLVLGSKTGNTLYAVWQNAGTGVWNQATNINYPDWMQHCTEIHQKQLKNICFPATHDTGTYYLSDTITSNPSVPLQQAIDKMNEISSDINKIPGIGKLINPTEWIQQSLQNSIQGLAQSTNQSVYQQLASGIRCLDIRLYYNHRDGKFYTSHAYIAASMDAILADLQLFLETTCGEIVYVTISHFNDSTSNPVYTNFLNSLEQQFKNYALPASTTTDLFSYTYNQVVNVNGANQSRVIFVNGDIDTIVNPVMWPSTYSPPDNSTNNTTLAGLYTATENYQDMLNTQLQQLATARAAGLPFALYLTLTPSESASINVTVSNLASAVSKLAVTALEIPFIGPALSAALLALAAGLKIDNSTLSYTTLKELSWLSDGHYTSPVVSETDLQRFANPTKQNDITFIYTDFFETTQIVALSVALNKGNY